MWAPAVGVALTAVAVVYWVRLQAAPQYVAMRGANALYGGGSPRQLEFHPDELAKLGLSQREAGELLEEIRREFLPGARITSDFEFRRQPGKDVLWFDVEMKRGMAVRAVVEVINEDGRGLLMFGDMVASYRASLFRADAEGAQSEQNYAALNGIRKLLLDAGVAGYWDIAKNKLEPWPEYTPAGERMASLEG